MELVYLNKEKYFTGTITSKHFSLISALLGRLRSSQDSSQIIQRTSLQKICSLQNVVHPSYRKALNNEATASHVLEFLQRIYFRTLKQKQFSAFGKQWKHKSGLNINIMFSTFNLLKSYINVPCEANGIHCKREWMRIYSFSSPIMIICRLFHSRRVKRGARKHQKNKNN